MKFDLGRDWVGLVKERKRERDVLRWRERWIVSRNVRVICLISILFSIERMTINGIRKTHLFQNSTEIIFYYLWHTNSKRTKSPPSHVYQHHLRILQMELQIHPQSY